MGRHSRLTPVVQPVSPSTTHRNPWLGIDVVMTLAGGADHQIVVASTAGPTSAEHS